MGEFEAWAIVLTSSVGRGGHGHVNVGGSKPKRSENVESLQFETVRRLAPFADDMRWRGPQGIFQRPCSTLLNDKLQVFPEFRVPQCKWATYRIDPEQLMESWWTLSLQTSETKSFCGVGDETI